MARRKQSDPDEDIVKEAQERYDRVANSDIVRRLGGRLERPDPSLTADMEGTHAEGFRICAL